MTSTLNPEAPEFIPKWTWSRGNGTPIYTAQQAREWGNAQAISNAESAVSNLRQASSNRRMAGPGIAASAAMGIGSGIMDLLGVGIHEGANAAVKAKDREFEKALAEQEFQRQDKRIALSEQAIQNDYTLGMQSIASKNRTTDYQFRLGLSQVDATNKATAVANRSLDIQQDQLNKQWEAARNLGLYSITQLGDASNTDFYKSTGFSSIPTRVKRTFGRSPFSF